MVGMAATMLKNMRDGVMTIYSGANTLTATFVEADFSFEIKKNVIAVFDRGVFKNFRAGNDELMTASFTVKYTGLIPEDAEESPWEGLTMTGAASGWASTTATTGDAYTVDVKMVYTDADGAGTEQILLDDFALTSSSFSEGDEYNTVSFSGICGGTMPSVTAPT